MNVYVNYYLNKQQKKAFLIALLFPILEAEQSRF